MAALSQDSDSSASAPATVEVNGEHLQSLGHGAYDVLICGTGLTECVLAGLLATEAKRRVLMIDRNPFYGASSASLDLNKLFQKFEGRLPNRAETAGFTKGTNDVHAFNCDLTPKFIMSDGCLARILQRTGATRYLDLYQVDGSFAAKSDGRKLHKVPATASEAVQSSLVGFFQKRRLRAVLKLAMEHETNSNKDRLRTITARQLLVDEHWCDESTCEFIGHCIALYQDDTYLDQSALQLLEDLRLYATSLLKYGNSSSPFLYPEYGLGGMPEAFARLCSINGGDFMLARDVSELVFETEKSEDGGRVCAVKSWNSKKECMEAARIHTVIGDPSYFSDERWRIQNGSVIRCICVLNGPVPGLQNRKNARGEAIESAQIIIPKSQCSPKRKHDIYVSVIGHGMQCTPEGIYCATISTMMESEIAIGFSDDEKGSNEAARKAALLELAAAFRVVGGQDNILKKFVEITPFFTPANEDAERSGVFVSRSCDATTHFESTTSDIMRIFEKITGQNLNLFDDNHQEIGASDLMSKSSQ